jgi:hypothetical protein
MQRGYEGSAESGRVCGEREKGGVGLEGDGRM